MAQRVFGFPDPVNEVSARLVAAGATAMTATVVLGQVEWMLIPLAYGFVARVLTGPTLSPLGRFVTSVVTPRLGMEPRWVPGPPKRFAQGIGAALSVAAVVAWSAGSFGTAQVLCAIILAAASLEACLGFCLGCKVFSLLMRVGVIPDSVCEACNDLSRRPVSV